MLSNSNIGTAAADIGEKEMVYSLVDCQTGSTANGCTLDRWEQGVARWVYETGVQIVVLAFLLYFGQLHHFGVRHEKCFAQAVALMRGGCTVSATHIDTKPNPTYRDSIVREKKGASVGAKMPTFLLTFPGSCPRRHLTKDLAGPASPLSLVCTLNKLIDSHFSVYDGAAPYIF
jgi:hypothetical protein